jgi:thioredoxin 1
MAEIIRQDVFEEKVLEADKPVLVDFYADWCGPCKMMIPVLDELSAEKADELTIYKINVDENPDIARQYKVMSIPTLILFKDGQDVKTVMGAMTKKDLWKQIEGQL